MKRTQIPTDNNRVRRNEARVAPNPQHGEAEYRVGPGRPPKEFQFKPGQSGNPKGARRKGSLVGGLKAELERALRQNVTLRQGEKEQTVTMRAAGIRQLVTQFANGDPRARRDLIHLAGKLGVDLMAGHGEGIEETIETAVLAEDQVLLADYVRRHGENPDPVASDPEGQAASDAERPEPTGTNL
jgi:hypothetical protein